MTIETAIEAALFGRVLTLDLLGGPQLAWPNKYFKPNGPYVRIDHLPNSTTRLFIGSVDPTAVARHPAAHCCDYR